MSLMESFIEKDFDRLRLRSTDWTGPQEELDKLLSRMRIAMKNRNGVGIAAIQIGVPVRVCIANNHVIINPKIKKLGSIPQPHDEGCLSLPNTIVRVKRKHSIELEYLDESLKLKKQTFKKFDAVVVQHELDHLNGKLIIDRGKKY